MLIIINPTLLFNDHCNGDTLYKFLLDKQKAA